ncbi:DNA-directed RNA polymerase subunit L [Candidatus Woesearchaeota archaeon]|nr:DNA-directed RNA polymerase subunit L [Candidatus Woesearchaeota archaeon]
MEISILEEGKGKLEIEIEGEDHTLCNALRNELWNHNVDIAAYNIEHPLVSNPTLMVHGTGDLRKKLVSASDSLRKMFKEIKDNFDKAAK